MSVLKLEPCLLLPLANQCYKTVLTLTQKKKKKRKTRQEGEKAIF